VIVKPHFGQVLSSDALTFSRSIFRDRGISSSRILSRFHPRFGTVISTDMWKSAMGAGFRRTAFPQRWRAQEAASLGFNETVTSQWRDFTPVVVTIVVFAVRFFMINGISVCSKTSHGR
jgi:hypothetical protein